MRWQIGVRAMLLLTAAFAVWFAYFQNLAEIARLEPRIASMHSLNRDLVIDDDTKIAAVMSNEVWMDDHRWEIYLPEGDYRLNLATREVPDDGLVPPFKSIAIPAGKRQLALEQKKDGEVYRLTVTLDGKKVIEAEEPKEWDPGRGSTGGGAFSTSTQFDAGKPVVLFRQRFMRPDGMGQFATPAVPCEGILLWIEEVR